MRPFVRNRTNGSRARAREGTEVGQLVPPQFSGAYDGHSLRWRNLPHFKFSVVGMGVTGRDAALQRQAQPYRNLGVICYIFDSYQRTRHKG